MRYILSILLFISLGAKGRQITLTVISNQIVAPNLASTYSTLPGDTLFIPSTATAYINLGNFSGTAAQRITVMSTAPIVANNPFTFFELTGTIQYVDFIFPATGNGYGLTVNNPTARGLTAINATLYDVSFYGMAFIGGTDYAIYFNHNRTYDGSQGSLNRKIRFDHCKVKNYGATNPMQFGFSGAYHDSLTFNDFIIDSVQAGTQFQLDFCFNVTAANSRITNTGLSAVNHAAVFFLRGDGIIEKNYVYNFWGDAVRAQGISLVTSKAAPQGKVIIRNDIFINSRKYPGVEANTQPGDTASSFIRPSEYYIMNNTVGSLAAVDYYLYPQGGGGAAFDIYYAFYKPVHIWNNAYFYCYKDKGQGISGLNYLWHDGNGSSTVDTAKNIYSPTGTDILADTALGTIKVPGPLVGAGSTLALVTTDFTGGTRTVPYDVGAYQSAILSNPVKIIRINRKKP